jgi:small subunit ribosomal protein S20
MPITKAAKKAIRQSQRRRIRNIKKRNNLKSLLKEVAALIAQASAKGGEEGLASSTSEKKTEEAGKLLPKVYKLLDKATKIGLIKKNTASRKKARITKAIEKAKSR